MQKTGPTVDELILSLPKSEQVIVKHLRSIILECLPRAAEKGYYGAGVPFYTHHRMICFIWPSSIHWGVKRSEEIKKTKLVTLGFCQGNLMGNENGLLKSEGRKQVYCMYLNSLAEIDEEQIRAMLYEAELIDDDFGKKKKVKKPKR